MLRLVCTLRLKCDFFEKPKRYEASESTVKMSCLVALSPGFSSMRQDTEPVAGDHLEREQPQTQPERPRTGDQTPVVHAGVVHADHIEHLFL